MASEESRREGIKQAYAATLQEEQEKKEALDAFADVFPGQVPQDEEFAKQNQDVQMLGVLKTTLFNLGLTEEEENRLQELGDKFKNQIPSEEKITEMEKEQERFAKLKEEKTQLETKMSYFEAMAMKREEPDYTVKNRLPMMICGIILLVIGAAGGVLSFLLPQVHKFFLPLLAVSVVAAVAGIVLLVVRKVQVSKEEEKVRALRVQHLEEERKLRDRWKKFKKPWKRLRKKLRASNRRPSIFWSSIRWFREKRMPEPACMNSAASCRNMSVCAAVPEKAMRQDRNLSGNRTLCLHLEKKREWISEKILHRNQPAADEGNRVPDRTESIRGGKKKERTVWQEHNMKELAAVEKCPYSLDELNSMIRDVDERSEDIREAIEQYHHQLEDLQDQLDIRDEKEQQLSICRQEQEEEQHLYETLRLTGEFLQNAKEQFSARYLGPIENGFGKYYTLLTGDKEKDWMVDANIEVQMKEQGEMRETKWLSAGYQDLLGICMRLALVDAMYPKEKPFLVLDDPFVNLDEEKMAHGNELFGKISGEYQILYFTCHASRNIENTK